MLKIPKFLNSWNTINYKIPKDNLEYLVSGNLSKYPIEVSKDGKFKDILNSLVLGALSRGWNLEEASLLRGELYRAYNNTYEVNVPLPGHLQGITLPLFGKYIIVSDNKTSEDYKTHEKLHAATASIGNKGNFNSVKFPMISKYIKEVDSIGKSTLVPKNKEVSGYTTKDTFFDVIPLLFYPEDSKTRKNAVYRYLADPLESFVRELINKYYKTSLGLDLLYTEESINKQSSKL